MTVPNSLGTSTELDDINAVVVFVPLAVDTGSTTVLVPPPPFLVFVFVFVLVLVLVLVMVLTD